MDVFILELTVDEGENFPEYPGVSFCPSCVWLFLKSLDTTERYLFSACTEIIVANEEFLPKFLLNAVLVPLVLQMSWDGLVSVGWACHLDALTAWTSW